jgi:protein-disulfide isomerase
VAQDAYEEYTCDYCAAVLHSLDALAIHYAVHWALLINLLKEKEPKKGS